MTRETSSPSEQNDVPPEKNASENQENNLNQRDGETAPEGNDAEMDFAARLELATTENAELRDRLLRAVAEMENLRKRSEREQKEARAYAIAGFARDMLTATDNLDRALSVLPPDFRDNADAQTKALIEGIDMTGREMTRLLSKNGISEIAAQGERFDPHKHQAMFEIADPEVPQGTVLQVVQTGYAIGDRILRPAMVGIAKGGPKTGREPEPGAGNAASATPADDVPDGSADEDGPHIDKQA